MDPDARDRWSALAHRSRRFCSPVSADRFAAVVASLSLPPDPYCVDLGCGKGEALRQVIAVHGGRGTGVDISARMLAPAPDDGRIDLVEADATRWRSDRTPDLAMCIGSTHIFGGLRPATKALAAVVGSGGSVVVGDGYWRHVPAQADLDAFGMDGGELDDLPTSVATVRDAGVTPLLVQPSTVAEWDDYEWALIREVELWSREFADDPDVDEFLARTRLMRDSYLDWRRDVFGFVLVAGVVD